MSETPEFDGSVEQDLVALVEKWSAEGQPPGLIAKNLGRFLGIFIAKSPLAMHRVQLQLTALCEFYAGMGQPERAEGLLKALDLEGGRHGSTTH